MKKAICWLFGHRYKVKRKITNSIYEMKCKRCGREFGMNTSGKSLVPMDNELYHLHNDLLHASKAVI